MDREWKAILERYGQSVTVYPRGEGQGVGLRAFLQPVLDKGREQEVPSPLGLRREDRFLYLGPPGTVLTAGVSRVSWEGREFEVQSAQPVGGQRSVHHWWAVLRPGEKEGL